MEAKYFCAKGMSADGLLTKANDVLKNVRVMAAGIRGVGTPLHHNSDSEREKSDGHAERVRLEEVECDAGDDLCSLKQR